MSKSKKSPDVEYNYVIIVGRRVIATAMSRDEALGWAEKHPGALVHFVHPPQTVDEIRKDMRDEDRRYRLKRNPIGVILEESTDGMLSSIIETIEKMVPHSSLSCEANDGFFYGGHDTRKSTDAECVQIDVELKLVSTIDSRRNIVKQLTKFMRDQVKHLEAMANEVESWVDVRNLSLMRRLVSEPGLAARMQAQGLILDFNLQKFVTREEYDKQYAEWQSQNEQQPAAKTAA